MSEKIDISDDIPYFNTGGISINIVEPNIVIIFGKDIYGFRIPFSENKTKLQQFKWWLFSKLFPVRYKWL
uniref:Uncharacterized protein n=1 Tax=viral metagenome TaxID=1070528 RepID=A0A6M3X6V7_9ZZZZ